ESEGFQSDEIPVGARGFAPKGIFRARKRARVKNNYVAALRAIGIFQSEKQSESEGFQSEKESESEGFQSGKQSESEGFQSGKQSESEEFSVGKRGGRSVEFLRGGGHLFWGKYYIWSNKNPPHEKNATPYSGDNCGRSDFPEFFFR
ncbi:MAG: hypothetical protein MUC87_21290, partial [Bacteroidia bacterium]|nr:hypothetical protein [Bacteroidia bacterium]